TVSGIGAFPVADAVLRLHVATAATADGGEGGTLRRISNNSWSESKTNWTNKPAIDGAALDSVIVPVVQNQLVDFHVGAGVTGDGTYNFALTSASSNAVKYDSRESSTPPKLIVMFRQPEVRRLPQVSIT